jgi:hypothetical protein
MMRPRDQGLLPYNFPSVRKLSTFIVGVIIPTGGNVYLDASNEDGWQNMLPEVLLVEKARLMQKGKKSEWINLQKLSKSQTSTTIEAVLDANGKLTGKQTTRYTGIAAAKFNQRQRAKGIEPEFAPEVTEVVEFTRQGTKNNDEISFNPFPEPPISDNPFTETKRLMPVEFPCIQSDVVVVNVTLPEGYTMAEDPRQTVVTTPDKGIDGRLFTTKIDNKIQIRYQFNANQIAHSEKNYDELRQIFDMFKDFSTKPMVVKKD